MDYSYDYFVTANLTLNNTINGSGYIDCLRYDYMDPACEDLYAIEPFKLTTGKVLSAIGIAILIVAALIGNILVCVAFCHYRRLRTVPNYFIISLAISDIMVAAFSMPLWLSHEVSGWQNLPAWIDFLKLVRFWECVDILAAVSSISNLAAISLDRLFSIIAPLRHKTRMTPVVGLIMISFAWLYALTISLCRLTDYLHFTAVVSALGFFLPLFIIVASYLGIYVKFRIRSTKQGNFEGDWNLEKTLMIVIGLFVVCWLPFFVTTLVYHYCVSCEFDPVTFEHVRGFVKWIHYLNSCCNPIVYGFCNINFKTAFWTLLGSCFARRYSDMDLAPSSRETSNSQAGTILRHLKSIKRKLSWKREVEVEESIVSNGGEVNDNSLSLAILALHLKNGQDVEGQEAQALLETTDSRPSSKASEDVGLLSDERSSVHESSGDEISVHRCQKGPTCNCLNSFQSRAREFTNRTYNNTHQDGQSKPHSNSFDVNIEYISSDIVPADLDEQNIGLISCDGNLGKSFTNKISAQLNCQEKRKAPSELECSESEGSTSDFCEKLIHCDSKESSPKTRDYLSVIVEKEKRMHSGFESVAIVNVIEDSAIELDVETKRDFSIIDTKESIV